MSNEKLNDLDPEVLRLIKEQVIGELEEKEAREKEKADLQMQKDLEVRADYVKRMKESDTPWMELVAITADERGQVKIELDWNGAFVDDLRKNGFTGPDDETVMQRYVAILARDVADDMMIVDDGE